MGGILLVQKEEIVSRRSPFKVLRQVLPQERAGKAGQSHRDQGEGRLTWRKGVQPADAFLTTLAGNPLVCAIQ